MKYSDNLMGIYKQLESQVAQSEKLRKPIDKLVKKQIDILECCRDDFVKRADAKGIDNFERSRVEFVQLSTIKKLAQKIGLPVEKYDEAIKKIRASELGEDI